MAKFNEYGVPGTITGDEILVVAQSGDTKSVTIQTIIDDLDIVTGVVTTTLEALIDTNITGASNGEVLTYQDSAWTNSPAASGASTLVELTDTNIYGTPSQDSVLVYNGSYWVDKLPLLSDLDDTNIYSPSPSHFLKWNGTDWVNNVIQISLCTDTDFGVLNTGDVLTYASNNKWTNVQPVSEEFVWKETAAFLVPLDTYITYQYDLGGGVQIVSLDDNTLYRTGDYGNTWSNITPAFTTFSHKLVINKRAEIIALGSSESFKSNDTGLTWTRTELTGNTVTSDEMVAHDNDNIVIIRRFSGPNSTVFRSDDFGDTWVEIEVETGRAGDSKVFWLGGSRFGKSIANVSNELMISDDGGLTWVSTPYTEGINGTMRTSVNGLNCSQRVSGNTGEYYISNDGARTWSTIDLGLGAVSLSTPLYVSNNLMFVTNSTNLNIAYSSDAGQTWSITTTGAAVRSTFFVAADGGTIIASDWTNTDEVYISYNAGQTWEQLPTTGLEENTYNDGVFITKDGKLLMWGEEDGGGPNYWSVLYELDNLTLNRVDEYESIEAETTSTRNVPVVASDTPPTDTTVFWIDTSV